MSVLRNSLVLLFQFTIFTLYAQPGPILIDQIHEIEQLSVGTNFTSIQKDDHNCIWLGSDSGLYRFDGHTTKRLDYSFVKNIHKKENGDILFLTDYGFFKLSPSQYNWQIDTLAHTRQPLIHQKLNFPKSLYLDKHGNTWIGEEKALVRYTNNEFIRYPLNNLDDSNSSLHRSFSFVEDGFGGFWAIGFNGQVFYYNKRKDSFELVETKFNRSISSAITFGDDRIWLGSNTGILEITVDTNGKIISENLKASIPEISKLVLTEDKIIVSTWGHGIYFVDYEGNAIMANDLQFSDVFDFEFDGNTIWVATRENVYAINKNLFSIIPGTINNYISSISLSPEGGVIVNTASQIFKANQNFQGSTQSSLFNAQFRFGMNDAILVNDKLWIVAYDGVYTYHLTSKKLQQIVSTENWYNEIYQSQNGTIWVSGEKETPVISIQNETIKYWDDLKNCRFLIEDQDATLFATGDEPAIYKMTNGVFQKGEINFPFSTPVIIEELAIRNDSLYLASNRGLWSLHKSLLGVPKLIIPGNISSVILDKEENIWFGSGIGLGLINGKDIKYFNRTNGLPSNYIERRSIKCDSDNRIWVSTSKGVAFAKLNYLNDPTTLRPRISDLFLVDQAQEIKDSFLGKFQSDKVLGLGLKTLSFPNSSLQYRYTLKKDGVIIDQKSSKGLFSFVNLNPGDYQLEIQAKQVGTNWSEVAPYTFSIFEPYYKKAWFYAVLMLLLIGCILLISRLANLRLRRSNERLEQLVVERTEEMKTQKNELIEQQQKIILQQNELLQQNETLGETQKALTASEIQYLELKKNQLTRELDQKAKQLTTHMLTLVEKNQYLIKISKQLKEIAKIKDQKTSSQNVKKLSQQITNSINKEDHWDQFRLYFEQVHTEFYTKLKVAYPALTSMDLKQCALVKLNLSLEDSASLLGVSPESIRVSRYRIQKKMNLSSQAAFYDFLLKL